MRTNNNEISKGIDGLLLLLYILLCLVGIVSIFAATYNEGENIVDSFISFRTDYGKQTMFFLFSLFAGVVIPG